MKTKIFLKSSFVGLILITIVCPVFSKESLSLRQMDSITGKESCCIDLTKYWCTVDGSESGETNGCKNCDSSATSYPDGCESENSQKWSGQYYHSCVSGTSELLCQDNGDNDCTKQYDCERNEVSNKTCNSSDKCETDTAGTWYCTECDFGESTSDWQSKPDKLCQ